MTRINKSGTFTNLICIPAQCLYFITDLPRPQSAWVYLPHRLLRVHRSGAVGRSDHLQDPPQLHRAPGHAQLGPQLRSYLWNRPRRIPLLHTRHGQGSADVPTQVSHQEIAAFCLLTIFYKMWNIFGLKCHIFNPCTVSASGSCGGCPPFRSCCRSSSTTRSGASTCAATPAAGWSRRRTTKLAAASPAPPAAAPRPPPHPHPDGAPGPRP